MLIPQYVQMYLFHPYSLSGQSLFLEDGKWPEDILFDHVDDKIEMGYDDGGHAVLVIEIVIEFLQVGLPVVLLFDLLGVIVVVHGIGARLQLLQELIPESGGVYLNSRGRCLGSVPFGPVAVVAVGLAVEVGLPVVRPGFWGFLLI